MPIDFVQGNDSEEKRFLAGILIVHMSEMMKRKLTEKMAHELQRPDGLYSESEYHSDKQKMLRYETLRKKGMRMLGANEWEKLDLSDHEVVCDLLTRFDVVRDVMES